jgi:hypothetical protein
MAFKLPTLFWQSAVRQIQVGSMQLVHGVSQYRQSSFVGDDIVSSLQAGGTAHLGGEYCSSLILAAAVAFEEPFQLHRLVNVDYQNSVHPIAATRFDQEWNFHYQVRAGSHGCTAFHIGPYQRMQDGLQLMAATRIREYQIAQGTPVERTLGCQQMFAEFTDDFSQPRAARRNHGTGRLVGVDDRHTEFSEAVGDSALSARNAPCKPDTEPAGHGSMPKTG